LAVVTTLLPMAVLFGLVQALRGARDIKAMGDGVALLAILQWCVVLAAWGLMPARTWAL
jgi:hypothetical protein